jgi:Na+/H+ antiporter NhaB
MSTSTPGALAHNFLGNAPAWYKQTIVLFLIINPVCLWLFGPQATGWLLIAEFIFTLAMALKCYPLLPGGLLATEALLLGMTSPETLYAEVQSGRDLFHEEPAAGDLYQYSAACALQVPVGANVQHDRRPALRIS